ncbi:MAG: hypothetical protein Q9165_006078 [Trypethelium subeluteriae]
MGVWKRAFPEKSLTQDASSSSSPPSPATQDLKTDPSGGITTHVESTTRTASSHFQTHATSTSKDVDIDVAANLFRSPTDLQASADIDPATERRLVRKIDRMILPYLAVCYAFFYIDKTTLSYAAIFGIKKDLKLVGTEYNWLSSIFYFGFLAWAIPTNFGLQRFPVGKYLGGNICAWGALLMLQAASNSFASLAALRALSGAAEACSDPAFMIITAMWYTRRQQPLRMGIWYTANGGGIALGGLLGYGIGHIRGALASWRYEFLIVGAACVIWGVVMMVMLPDSPVTAKGLSWEERRCAVERLRADQTGVENKRFKAYQVKEAALDPKTYLLFLLGVVGNVPNGGISNFGTLIIQGFGFSTLVTTLMQIPYGVLIALSILACVFLNDYTCAKRKMNTRCIFILLWLCPNIAGAFMLAYVGLDHKIARLWGYYLTGPYNAAFVMILSLSTANTAGHTKKVFTNAVLFLGYCTGNIIDGPSTDISAWDLEYDLLSLENRRRDRLYGKVEEKDLDETAFGDLTDRENKNFRYVF